MDCNNHLQNILVTALDLKVELFVRISRIACKKNQLTLFGPLETFQQFIAKNNKTWPSNFKKFSA